MIITVGDVPRRTLWQSQYSIDVNSDEDIRDILYTIPGVASMGVSVLQGSATVDDTYIYKLWLDTRHDFTTVWYAVRQVCHDCMIVDDLLRDVHLDLEY